MEITVNGLTRAWQPGLTVRALLEREGCAERRVAVEINGEIVPKSRHHEHALVAGDHIEIVQAIGGG